MKIAYLQCPTGIAGDMCLGAIVDAGVPLAYLQENLGRLGIAQEYKLWTESVHRNGLRATKFHVDLVSAAGETVSPDAFHTFDHPPHAAPPLEHTLPPAHGHSHPHGHAHDHPHAHGHPHAHDRPHPSSHSHSSPLHPPVRHLPEIEQLIFNAELPPRAANWSLAVFRTLAVAEGAVHGIPPEQVHFHEVGATDALVDIIGTCLGLDWLGLDGLVCSPLPTGGGTIRAAHGRLPVPAPAVLKLFELGQVPVYSNGIERELVTPTGAAIATTLAHQFGPPPTMTLHRVGLGAGTSEFSLPNILQLWIGETEAAANWEQQAALKKARGIGTALWHPQPVTNDTAPLISDDPATETILVLVTQIDDLNPQAIGYVLDLLLAAGALDVFTQAIAMKKSRPGILLTVICRPADQERCTAILFRETTTLGIRCLRQERRILPREIQAIATPLGEVRVKVAWAEGRDQPPTHVQPEYEDCARHARAHQVPWRQVHQHALQAWYEQATEPKQ